MKPTIPLLNLISLWQLADAQEIDHSDTEIIEETIEYSIEKSEHVSSSECEAFDYLGEKIMEDNVQSPKADGIPNVNLNDRREDILMTNSNEEKPDVLSNFKKDVNLPQLHEHIKEIKPINNEVHNGE